MELHFYPGQNLLILKEHNKLIAKFEAMGGPSKVGDDPRMAEEPTWPGTYFIDRVEAYRTPTWRASRIKWGTPIKQVGDDIWYQMASGKWGSVRAETGIQRPVSYVVSKKKQLYGEEKIPQTWIFNDFGPIAIRWFKDLNGNHRLDRNEQLSGQMFHTTPENEAETKTGKEVVLVHSHGCIHLKPNDRDRMLSLGAFKKGNYFKVHEYYERY